MKMDTTKKKKSTKSKNNSTVSNKKNNVNNKSKNSKNSKNTKEIEVLDLDEDLKIKKTTKVFELTERNSYSDYKKILLDNYNKHSVAYKMIFTCIIGFILCFIGVKLGFILQKEVIVEKEVIKKEIKNDENIVFLGDSLFDLYDLKHYYEGVKTVNSGVSGATSKNVLENMEARVYRYNPSKVFLLIGTNDYFTDVSLEGIASNIRSIVKNIKDNRPYSEVYVLSVLPIHSEISDRNYPYYAGVRSNEDIDKTNVLIKKVCNEEKVDYINLHDKLLDDSGRLNEEYTSDGLHISEKGYEVITKELNNYLSK